MKTKRLKLITIVADRLLADTIVGTLHDLGASGYTMTEALGQGKRGLKPLDWEGANVRIESITTPETADRIVADLSEKYFNLNPAVGFSSW